MLGRRSGSSDRRAAVVARRSPSAGARRLGPRWLARAVLTAVATVLVPPLPVHAGPIEIQFIAVIAAIRNSGTGVLQQEQETASSPFFSFASDHGAADGIARASVVRGGPFLGRSTYAASLQSSFANAVAAGRTYADGPIGSTTPTADMFGGTLWQVEVKNTSPVPQELRFSFFLSGGGLDLYCAACRSGLLKTSVSAEIKVAGEDPVWRYDAALEGRPLSDSGEVARAVLSEVATYDRLKIGTPKASIVRGPSGGDPFTTAEIGFFEASMVLQTLDPGDTAQIEYRLEAGFSGVTTALGRAWLTDPFSLGEPGALPDSRFAIGGLPFAVLLTPAPGGDPTPTPGVPTPSAGALLLGGLALLALASTRRRRLNARACRRRSGRLREGAA